MRTNTHIQLLCAIKATKLRFEHLVKKTNYEKTDLSSQFHFRNDFLQF